MFDVDKALQADLQEKTAAVMNAVYRENPDHWPAGLATDMFSVVHPVISGVKLAGFVGWQEIDHPELGRTGYYAVGLLPPFRGQGLAKKACVKIIEENKHRVTNVRAFIVDGNTASEKLAKSLGVEVDRHDPRDKSASAWGRRILQLLSNKGFQAAGMGLGGAALAALENRDVYEGKLDPATAKINLLMGMLTGATARYNPLLAVAPWTGKQIALNLGQKFNEGVDAFKADAPLRAEAARNALETAKLEKDRASTLLEQAKTWTPETKLLAGALGLGGLGLGLYGYNSLKGKSRGSTSSTLKGDPDLRRKSKVKIEIPANALDKSFYEALTNIDDRPEAKSVLQTPAKVAAFLLEVDNFFLKEAASPKQTALARLTKALAGDAAVPSSVSGDLLRAGAGGATGYYLGKQEVQKLKDEAGLPVTSFAESVVPWTNAAVGALLSSGLRRGLFGDMSRPGQNRAVLNSILLKAGLGNAALLGADQLIGMSGQAQQAMKGVGDAGTALSEVSKTFKEKGTKSLDDVKKITGDIAAISEATKGHSGKVLDDVSKATGEAAPLLKSLAGAGQGLTNLADTASKGIEGVAPVTKSMLAASNSFGGMTATIKDVAKKLEGATETGNRLADLATLGVGGTGGAALGGLLGYGLSEDPDKADTVADRRALENKRMRHAAVAAALTGVLGASAPFVARRLLAA